MDANSPSRPVDLFFSGMSKKHLETLAQLSVYAEFGAGDVIFREGGPADCFYLIEHGKVALEADMDGEGLVQIVSVTDGEPLGWSWLFPPYIWHFHARALQRTTTACYDGKTLRQICEEDHGFGYELLKRMSQVMLLRLQATRHELAKIYSVSKRN